MKNLIFFATLLIFMLNFSDNLISAQAQDEKTDPVLDRDGNEVTTGTRYYIVPISRPGSGGGVTIYPRAKNCTNGVAQLEFGDGLPVTFSYGGTDPEDVVRESTNLTISFSPGILYFPAVWKVDEYDPEPGKYFVTAGEIDPDETSINKWFQIRRVVLPESYTYRFEFCIHYICTDVGTYFYEGVRRFALGESFTLKFKKFEAGTNSIGRLEA